MIGKTLSRYQVVEQIGAGGMGAVYRARDDRLSRDVALKVLPPGRLSDDAARQRFRQEALALSQLNHPNIATVHDFDTEDGVDFLVMEHIAGISLDDQLASGALPEKEVVRYGIQCAQGLAAAHDRGIIHADLKPGNVRITPDGRAKILDFGLARLLEPTSDLSLTQSGGTAASPMGTLPYMAPEQLRNEKLDSRTDIYALGAVLYEMATGRRPFPETHGPMLIDAILHQDPVPPRALNRRTSADLERIVLKCLDKEREHRYQSARELQVDLERIGKPSTAPLPVVTGHGVAPHPGFIVAGLALAAALVVLVLDVGGLRSRLFGRPGLPRIQRIAVLPLENLSRDPEHFVAVMDEILTNQFSQVSALQVTNRRSVLWYARTGKSPKEVARELGVDALVHGSVLRSGAQLRITLQCSDAASGANLWADTFEPRVGDEWNWQGAAVNSLAHALQVPLTSEEQARLAQAHATNDAAREAYMRGIYFWNKREKDDLNLAKDYFVQAIKADPDYSPAYAALANSYLVLLGNGLMPAEEAYRGAHAAATRALELDENLGDAHTALASIHFFKFEWPQAEREFRRAIELNPSDSTAHHWYALLLSAAGRHPEALEQIQRAQRLDPKSLIISANIGWCYYLARQYDQAIESARRTLEADAGFSSAYGYMAQAYLEKSMFDEAIRNFRKALSLAKDSPGYRAELANAYALAVKTGEAQALLNELLAMHPRGEATAYHIAYVYAGLGNREETFAWLEKSAANREGNLVNLRVHPRFDVMRTDRRFTALLRRLGLQP
jgi:serine/threonine protein kinase/tetratricopeptide (TPR) repeat protein